MKLRTIVCPLIRNKNNQYLICKMPSSRGAFPGQWGIPGGGIEAEEEMMAALQREIKEELGDKLILSQIVPWTFRDDHCEKLFPDGKKEKIYMIYLLFDCLAENTLVELNEEFEEYAWVEPCRLKEYDLNAPTRITFAQKGLAFF
jgi:nucleoside triphosphatase